ncbi:MAG: hypothetical protein ABII01_06475 [Candidatus Woesearchaeota archaeon]
MEWDFLKYILIGIIGIAILGYIVIPFLINNSQTFRDFINKWVGEEKDEEAGSHPNLITLKKVDPAGEVLNYNLHYDSWIDGDEKLEPTDGVTILFLTFDKPILEEEFQKAIEVYREDCTGVWDTVLLGCGGTSARDDYTLLSSDTYDTNWVAIDDHTYLSIILPGDSGVLSAGQDYIIRFKKEYIAGQCQDNCKYLDGERSMNPATVVIKFET